MCSPIIPLVGNLSEQNANLKENPLTPNSLSIQMTQFALPSLHLSQNRFSTIFEYHASYELQKPKSYGFCKSNCNYCACVVS